MRRLQLLFAPLLLTALFGAACSKSTPQVKAVGSADAAGAAEDATLPLAPAHRAAAFASLPDRGNLLGYPAQRVERREHASTWHRADISEQHALRAVVTGEMTVTAPDGQPIRLHYQRHLEHPNGNWTWIGRDEHGEEAIVTFGEKAVFGSIPRHGGEELRLATSGGRSWVVEADPSKQHHPDPKLPDYVVPPELAQSMVSGEPVTASASMEAVTPAAVGTTIDVALGYTTGFASELGGDSQAATRLQNLVDITNQAYANSRISAQIRLVRTVAVNYADATDNNDVLSKLSGYQSGSGSIPVDPAFAALRSARDQYGADLVSLVRRFRAPENKGCGVAWLIGGDQSRIDNSDAPWGYSVVSDDLDRGDLDETDRKTYVCRKETLAHELGHNMGQAHNSEDSEGTPGAHSYSYGYREASTTGFYTVMAYRLVDSGQKSIRYFANPNVLDAGTGRPTGIANVSDNARSMVQTMPIVAMFRNGIADVPAGQIMGMGGKCLDASGRGTANGTALQVYSCNGEAQQSWRWDFQGAPSPIIGVGSGRAMDVIGYGTVNGTQIHLWDYLGGTNQNWAFTNFEIVGNASGRVLDTVGMSSANGTEIQLWDGYFASNQVWYFNRATGAIVGKDGKCLDVRGFGLSNGTPVQLWSCAGTDNQKWRIASNGTIVGYGGKCLEATNAGVQNGTRIRMWDCNGGQHQSWSIYGEIRSQASDRCLDDPNNGALNGSRPHIWDCHGGQNQKWWYAWH